MSNRIRIFTRVVFLTLAALTCHLTSHAQLTIFNIPSTDTVSKRSFYLEGDFATKPVRFRSKGFRTYGYKAVYGLNNKTEIGGNFFFTRSSGELFGEIQLGAKRKLYNNERRGIAVAAGTLIYVPLKSFSGARSSALMYSNISKNFKKLRGLRTTVGAYTVLGGGGKSYGTKSGFMIGVEKPVSKRITFIADWFTGKNRLGYSAAGISFAVTKRQFFNIGYNFGNSGAGNNALSFLYAYTF
ncbi:hypothetical protein BH10ACI2_BH10ACI2_09930 [soil metagenome]